MDYNRSYNLPPLTTLDEVLIFINYYGYQGEISYGILKFSHGVEFKREHNVDALDTLMRLHSESCVNLELKGKFGNEFGVYNKKLNKRLEVYKEKILGKIRYDVFSLQRDWNEVKVYIQKGDYVEFDITIIGKQFLTLLFSKITEEIGYSKINKTQSAKSLYKIILDKTDKKQNYDNEIVVPYKLESYLEEKILVFPILSELQNKGSIKIENVIIKKSYIYFHISHIIEISESLFVETAKDIEQEEKQELKVSYDKKDIYIDGKAIAFDSENTIIYQIFRLAFDTFDETKTSSVSWEAMIKQLTKNPTKYSKITQKRIDNQDSDLRLNIKKKNKSILSTSEIDNFLVTDVNGIQCPYYNP